MALDYPLRLQDEKIFSKLKTLQHGQKFSEPFADYIMGRGLLTCSHIHGPQHDSCGSYWRMKMGWQFKQAASLQLILLIPQVMMSMKKLRQNPKKEARRLLINFLRSTLYIMWIGLGPWVYCCTQIHVLKLPGLHNSMRDLMHIGYTIAMMALLVEPVGKHSLYFGFYLPNFIKTFYDIFLKKHGYKDLKYRSFVQIVLICGVIGVAHSRGHY